MDPDPSVKGTDSQIRIRTKISQIPNIAEKKTSAPCLVVEEVVVGHENDIGRLVALSGHVVGTEAVLLTCTTVVTQIQPSEALNVSVRVQNY